MLTLASRSTDLSADAMQEKVWPMMSVLVHELRQPLSIIDACADYLNLVLPAHDDGARQQLELLQQQIGEANRILHDALLNLHYTDAHAEGDAAATKPASSSVTY